MGRVRYTQRHSLIEIGLRVILESMLHRLCLCAVFDCLVLVHYFGGAWVAVWVLHAVFVAQNDLITRVFVDFFDRSYDHCLFGKSCVGSALLLLLYLLIVDVLNHVPWGFFGAVNALLRPRPPKRLDYILLIRAIIIIERCNMAARVRLFLMLDELGNVVHFLTALVEIDWGAAGCCLLIRAQHMLAQGADGVLSVFEANREEIFLWRNALRLNFLKFEATGR